MQNRENHAPSLIREIQGEDCKKSIFAWLKMSSLIPKEAEKVLNFWFSPSKSSSYGKEKAFWFNSNESWDSEIRSKFLTLHERAAKGEFLETWTSHPYSTLALILLLDQVPRNIFRNTPKQHGTDAMALKIAKFALKRSYLQELILDIEKKFCIMPFSHSEVLRDQGIALGEFEALGNPGWHSYAQHYYNIIERFGRFPHRNQVLGRDNTKEEEIYLNS